MDPVTIAAFVGVFIVILLALNAWRGSRGGDVAGGKGPFSTGMEVRGGMAALGSTLDERKDVRPEAPSRPDAVDDD